MKKCEEVCFCFGLVMVTPMVLIRLRKKNEKWSWSTLISLQMLSLVIMVCDVINRFLWWGSLGRVEITKALGKCISIQSILVHYRSSL